MKILSIECSSGSGSIALVEGGRTYWELVFENPRGRGGEFFAALEEAAIRCDDFGCVLVGTGPGSYNGLRASIAAGWGLARARGVALQGISSVFGYDAAEYVVLGDARAGQWFFAHVRDGRLVRDVELLSPEVAQRTIPSGLPVFTTSPLMESACFEYPRARFFPALIDQAGPAEPIYLKPPHITKPAA
jgi:tRNA A37 threonylcarbamoyladenosine modification protein TsaB